MWCIGEITPEYRRRMYALLALYKRPYSSREPVICVDEKSKQILQATRPDLPHRPGRVRHEDYEYKRLGTRNIFVAVEPKGKRRFTEVTLRRTKVDCVKFFVKLLHKYYPHAKRVHFVLDNLNTHFRKTFEDVLGSADAGLLLKRVLFHYTPKHASWLNMAEIEIGIMDAQCTGRRFDSGKQLSREVTAWRRRRDASKLGIAWSFTRQKADRKLSKHYV